jgi:uncharacterized protein
MPGETNLAEILSSLQPTLNEGEFVFCTVKENFTSEVPDAIMTFKEEEGNTLILKKETADKYNLTYSFVASWITLTVYSSLEAVGLTAAFSKALTQHNISCNVVAGYYHDHIFVAKDDAEKAMKVLTELAEKSKFFN